MPFLSNLVGDNRVLYYGAIGLAGIVAVLLVWILYRAFFGSRLRLPGGASSRTRQPRLGVVDAFDLDHHRQLVLVRRDNVEHLIMVGGPNDVVIETQIIRAQALPAREAHPAEREAAPRGSAADQARAMLRPVPSEPAHGPAPPVSVVPAPGPAAAPVVAAVQMPPRSPAPPNKQQPQPVAPVARPATVPPPAAMPSQPVPPMPVAVPARAVAVPAAPPPPQTPPPQPQRPVPVAPVKVAPAPVPPPKPAAATPPAPPPRPAQPAKAVAPAPRPVPQVVPPPPPSTQEAANSGYSLEEEMAKLLGRPLKPGGE